MARKLRQLKDSYDLSTASDLASYFRVSLREVRRALACCNVRPVGKVGRCNVWRDNDIMPHLAQELHHAAAEKSTKQAFKGGRRR
jgi:hypothetical protein